MSSGKTCRRGTGNSDFGILLLVREGPEIDFYFPFSGRGKALLEEKWEEVLLKEAGKEFRISR